MLVKMRTLISGPRDGQQWPGIGEVIDLPDDEAATLVHHHMAEAVEVRPDLVETADVPAGEVEVVETPEVETAAVVEDVETATPPKPRGRPRKTA